MNWEKRGKSDYYYRKYRIGNSVVSRYAGSGKIADLAAEHDQYERNLASLVNGIRRDTYQNEKEMDKLIRMVMDRNNQIFKGLMLASGFHMHKGQWRKKDG